MISFETRYRAVVHYKDFLKSLRKVCKIYKVSKSSLHRWVNADQVGKSGRLQRKRKELSMLLQTTISNSITENPFITCKELVGIICKSCNVGLSISTASRYMKQCGFSRKKAFSTVLYRHSKENVEIFCDKYRETSEVVCIDEAGFYAGDV